MPDSCQRWAVTGPDPGAPHRLLETVPTAPAGRSVLIRVHRAGVALGDLLRARGLVPGTRYPFTPGYDVAGEVIEVGPEATGFRSGDRVVAYTLTGGYSQVVTVPDHRVARLPPGVGYAEAAAIVLNYVTAYQMLERTAGVAAGQAVLIQGATGGVGTALLQLGRLRGLTLYGTTTAAKRGIVTDLGGIPVDREAGDYVDRIRRAHPQGLDAVFESVSPASARRSRRLLRPGGTLVYYGFVALARGGAARPAGGLRTALELAGLVLTAGRTRLRIYGIDVDGRRGWFQEDIRQLLGLLGEGKIRPIIQETLPLSRAHEALERLYTGSVTGKLLLDCTQASRAR